MIGVHNYLALIKGRVTSYILLLISVCAARIALLSISFSHDFVDWVFLGIAVTQGHLFHGVYTGPSLILASAYWLWLRATNDSIVATKLYELVNTAPSAHIWTELSPSLMAFNLTMKGPLIIADLLTMLMIVHIVTRTTSSLSRGMVAGLMWAGSPLVFLLEMFNTVEIYPAAFILLGAYAIYNSQIGRGATHLAIGTILRFAPSLLAWIYPLALARSRQFRQAVVFVGVQFVILLSSLLLASYFVGFKTVAEIFGQRPGIIVGEGWGTMGPFLFPQEAFSQYGIPLTATACIFLGYFLSKPVAWRRREVGSEVVAFFAMYFAFSTFSAFSAYFLLWMLPSLVVYTAASRVKIKRYGIITSLAFLYTCLSVDTNSSLGGKGLFFLLNLNSTMEGVSSSLPSPLAWPFVQVFTRTLFTGSLLLMLIFTMTETQTKQQPSGHLPLG